MKNITVTLCLVVLFGISLTSCSNDEDGIYFDDTTQVLNAEIVDYSPLEKEILELVNIHRESLGLSTLTSLNIVSTVADTHTNYMIETGEISHDNFASRMNTLMKNAKAKSVGENVAYGYSSAQGAVNGWLNSDGHKKIIEDPDYTHFGISTERNSEGRNYFTHIFINK